MTIVGVAVGIIVVGVVGIDVIVAIIVRNSSSFIYRLMFIVIQQPLRTTMTPTTKLFFLKLFKTMRTNCDRQYRLHRRRRDRCQCFSRWCRH